MCSVAELALSRSASIIFKGELGVANWQAGHSLKRCHMYTCIFQSRKRKEEKEKILAKELCTIRGKLCFCYCC